MFLGMPRFPSTRTNGNFGCGFTAPEGSSIVSQSERSPGSISRDALGGLG
jgi:hypothetical protein